MEIKRLKVYIMAKWISGFAIALAISIFTLIDVSAAPKIKVVTTTTDLKSLVEAVGKDRVEVTSIAKGYQDPHFVEAKPSDMIKLKNADMFAKVGLDLEIWSQLLIDGSRNEKIFQGRVGHVDASVGVKLLQIPELKLDRSMGDIHLFGNPHYWLDPSNGKVILENILKSLEQVSPGGSEYFRKNKDEYIREIDNSISRWAKDMEPYKGTKVVTYHNSWPNFAEAFGLEVVGYVEPKPGIPSPPTHIASLIELIKKEKVKIIIVEPYFSEKLPNLIANSTGSRVLILPPSVGGVKGVDTYIGLFDYNISRLVEALGEAGGKK